MRKNLLILAIATVMSGTISADVFKDCRNNYHDSEHLNSCLGEVLDASIMVLAKTPSNTQNWNADHHEDVEKTMNLIKNNICNDGVQVKEVIVEVPVEKIIYVEKIKEVPAKLWERHCTTRRSADHNGNIEEVITCTEWQ